MYKTINEWEEIFEVKVIDPDGFDRTNPNLFEETFTKEEFEKGLAVSTIMGFVDIDGSNPVIQIYKVYDDGGDWCAYDDIDQALEHYKIEVIENDNLEAEIEVDFMRKKTFDTLPEYQG